MDDSSGEFLTEFTPWVSGGGGRSGGPSAATEIAEPSAEVQEASLRRVMAEAETAPEAPLLLLLTRWLLIRSQRHRHQPKSPTFSPRLRRKRRRRLLRRLLSPLQSCKRRQPKSRTFSRRPRRRQLQRLLLSRLLLTRSQRHQPKSPTFSPRLRLRRKRRQRLLRRLLSPLQTCKRRQPKSRTFSRRPRRRQLQRLLLTRLLLTRSQRHRHQPKSPTFSPRLRRKRRRRLLRRLLSPLQTCKRRQLLRPRRAPSLQRLRVSLLQRSLIRSRRLLPLRRSRLRPCRRLVEKTPQKSDDGWNADFGFDSEEEAKPANGESNSSWIMLERKVPEATAAPEAATETEAPDAPAGEAEDAEASEEAGIAAVLEATGPEEVKDATPEANVCQEEAAEAEAEVPDEPEAARVGQAHEPEEAEEPSCEVPQASAANGEAMPRESEAMDVALEELQQRLREALAEAASQQRLREEAESKMQEALAEVASQQRLREEAESKAKEALAEASSQTLLREEAESKAQEASAELEKEKILREETELKAKAATDKREVEVKKAPVPSIKLEEATAESAIAFASPRDLGGEHVADLLALLNKFQGQVQVVSKVCTALENLTFSDVDVLSAVVQGSGVEMLLSTLQLHEGEEAAMLRSAVDTLWNLTFDEKAVDRATASGAVERLAAVMAKHPTAAELQVGCCAVLLNLAVVEQNRYKIVQCGACSLLASAVETHNGSEEVVEHGCQALYMLAYHNELRPMVLASRGAEAASCAARCQGPQTQKWGRWLQEVLQS
ncbi:unnamed protein product [Effrenium voratum]|uniref:Uncharacterized protein n=1 Tax=Effrenium voratum TaxID=2562239 RepID=A0AA36IYS7_9DINO|nr:unnamed protein product [Effrenium voratum]